ncbi:DUF58 domain-containing protein [Halorarius halobius]|uniref:DUF58 domain-containing protein n=1 Tax=Halorarius halobius TaxID=2962671 RepID=UPI0020CD50DC|nr:DUF58 domain-containing protein [Halorarius halobius]
MRLRRVLLLGVGATTAALGAAMLAVPSLGRAVDALVVRAALILLGVVAVAAAGRTLLRTRDADAERPTPERRPTYRRPDDALATLLDGAWPARSGDGSPEAVRETLRELAAETLVATTDADRDAAEASLDAGTWTDDAPAAAFFTGAPASLRDRLRALAAGEPTPARRARHAAAAIAALTADETARPTRDPLRGRSGGTLTGASPTTGRSTGRGRVVAAGALLVGGIGVLGGRPALLLVGGLGLAVVAVGRSFGAPEPTVRVDRDLSTPSPAPGEQVTVTVTVENTGDAPLFDLRVVDGVPAGLTVADGSPRLAAALRPGAAASTSYEVEAVPGRHAFDSPTATARDPTGTRVETRPAAAPETVLTCGFGRLEAEPGQSVAGAVPGAASTATAGPGVEFHSVREYRPGDPLGSVDWRRFARTGEFATVRYREERLSPVVVVVDARAPAYVAPPDADVPAVQRGVRAAYAVAAGLLADGRAVPVGLTALSPHPCWLATGTGGEQLDRIRAALLGDPAFDWTAPDRETGSLDGQVGHLPPDGHAVLVSPLADDAAVGAARRLAARGGGCTVLSPAVADPARPDEGFAYARRNRRIEGLRAAGVAVVDWPWERPVEEVLARDG